MSDRTVPIKSWIPGEGGRSGAYLRQVHAGWRFWRLLISLPVWVRHQLIYAGLERVPSHMEKLCIVSYYVQFSENKKCTIMILKPVLLDPRCIRDEVIKLVLILLLYIFIYFRIKLFIIRCNK